MTQVSTADWDWMEDVRKCWPGASVTRSIHTCHVTWGPARLRLRLVRGQQHSRDRFRAVGSYYNEMGQPEELAGFCTDMESLLRGLGAEVFIHAGVDPRDDAEVGE